MHNIFKIFFLTLMIALIGIGCQKESYEKAVTNNYSLENIEDTVYFGKTMTINIIKTQDVKTLELSLVSVSSNEVVLKDTLQDTASINLMASDIVVPADGSWAGDYVVKLTAPGNSLVRTDTVYFKKGVDNYYLVGGSCSAGWEPTAGIQFGLFSKDGSNFYEQYGYYTTDGSGLKVLPTNVNWDGGFGTKTTGILSTDGDAGNIPVATTGFYRMRLNMTDLTNATYTLVSSKWGIIGDATTHGWDASTAMIAPTSKGSYAWTLTTTLTAGSFKFRENDAWDVNLGTGSSTNDLAYDGGNISIATAGTYKITLNLNPTAYTYSLEKQ